MGLVESSLTFIQILVSLDYKSESKASTGFPLLFLYNLPLPILPLPIPTFTYLSPSYHISQYNEMKQL